MIDKQVALSLKSGAILHHVSNKGADGLPVRCRVNGACRTWKTRPADFRLPVKHGLRTCFYITPDNADQWERA